MDSYKMCSCVINHLSNFVYVQGWSFKWDLVKKKKKKRKKERKKNCCREECLTWSSEQWWCFLLVVQLLSHIWLFMTPWTIAHQAPLSMGFPRKKYYRRLPFPSPGDGLNPGIKPTSPASPSLASGFFDLWATRETQTVAHHCNAVNLSGWPS